jgi:DNA-binding CsgD family transcriptional regulator
MLVFGTQMHIVTFLFVCVELVILFYLIIYRLARPDDRAAALDVILIILLLTYNITGGLLPDPNLPGSYFIQESIAYGTGFITPCYFPNYVYKGFALRKMKFHAFRGVYFFLVLPYLLFVFLFYITANIDVAKNVLIIPVLYALWVVNAVRKAIRLKYFHHYDKRKSKEEIMVLFISLTPWIGLPVIAYFNLNQAVEAITTNTGFLLLLALHLKRNVEQLKEEHLRLIESERNLQNWNEKLQQEVDKRTREIEQLTMEERITTNCRLYHLTNRETEIARLICRGITYKRIGELLFIAERTVAKHVQNIFEKVSVSNKLELCNKLEKNIDINTTALKIN